MRAKDPVGQGAGEPAEGKDKAERPVSVGAGVPRRAPGKKEAGDAVKRLQQLLASGEFSRDNFSFVIHEPDVLIPRIT